ncbi:MAG: bifunctional DNA-formamidopyrimidine glycosylase/DNA-(apurinic or apyrimidinic site) lyase [Candidatus Aquicultor sp.]
MPELPEAETIRRELEKVVVGRKIVDVQVSVPRVLRMPSEEFEQSVDGATITGVGRRAKMVIVHLSSGDSPLSLLFHLMIAGSIRYVPVEYPEREKAQVILTLDNGHEIRFRDPRKFGYVKLIKGDIATAPELSHLGPEPLSGEFTLGRFQEMLKRRANAKIKALLLDQSFVAGIGNIYADEVLFHAGVLPTRPAGSLSGDEIRRIYEGIRSILTKAIEEHGSSIATYVDIFGNKGNFVSFFKVYGRTGEPCVNSCPGEIKKTKVAGRGTHICPVCQK